MPERKRDYKLTKSFILVGCLPLIATCNYGRIQRNIFTSSSFTWNPPQRDQLSNPICRNIKPERKNSHPLLKPRWNDKVVNINQNQAALGYNNLISCILANHGDEINNNNRDDDDDDDDEKKIKNNDKFRLSFLGASVSPNGFIALLSTSSIEGVSKILPIRISSNPSDEFSASSVEALTILQLLAGVDMASEGVLPVGILGRIVALYCSLLYEANDNDDDSNIMKASSENDQKALDVMHDVLKGVNYATATPWQRVRVNLPYIKLEELIIIPCEDCKQFEKIESPESTMSPFVKVSFILKCKVEGNPLSIEITLPVIEDISSSASFSSDSTTSDALIAFYSLALALRYKVPINISSTSLKDLSSSILYHAERNNISPEPQLSASTIDSKNNLLQMYPKWKSTSSLQFQSSRALKTIERGFKANRLDGALQIAIQKGDVVAEQKIREKMKEYESLDDLPVASGVSAADDVILDGEDGEEHWA